jgi:hypothetical protein
MIVDFSSLAKPDVPLIEISASRRHAAGNALAIVDSLPHVPSQDKCAAMT